MILDGLAWAGIPEKVRIARIAAMLVRESYGRYSKLTQTRIKEAVRETSPPYGRGKAITEAVTLEIQRQAAIYGDRQKKREAFEGWEKEQARYGNRLNRAYAYAFGRPVFAPTVRWNGIYEDYDDRDAYWKAREEFDQAERERDKGDECTALTHYYRAVVALVSSQNQQRGAHIAVRHLDGTVVRTYFRNSYTCPSDFADAAGVLGGPKVRAAISKGKKVITDWVGRRSLIHHEGQDHHHPGIEIVPWQASIPGDRRRNDQPVLVLGDSITEVTEDEDEE